MQNRCYTDLSYADIKDILNDYDAHKGVRRRKLGDYPHIVIIKTALDKAINQTKMLSGDTHTPSVPFITQHDTIEDNRSKLSKIKIFITFYKILTSELNKVLPGKRSIRALRDIKTMIDASNTGRCADFWREVELENIDESEHAYINFFIKIYSRLVSSNPFLSVQKQYSAKQIKDSVPRSSPQLRAELDSIKLDERLNNDSLTAFNEYTHQLTNREKTNRLRCLSSLTRYYFTSHNFQETLDSWGLAVIFKNKADLNLLTQDIILNRETLHRVTTCLSTLSTNAAWKIPAFMDKLIAQVSEYRLTPLLATAIRCYFNDTVRHFVHSSQIVPPGNKAILFENALNIGCFGLLWSRLNQSSNLVNALENLQHQFNTFSAQMKKLSLINISVLDSILLRHRKDDFFNALLQICNAHQDLDQCTEHLNNYINEVKKASDIEKVYRAFFPVDDRLINLNHFGQRIAQCLPQFLNVIELVEFAWIPDHQKGADLFNGIYHSVLQGAGIQQIYYNIIDGIYIIRQPREHIQQRQRAAHVNPRLDRQNTHTASVHRTASQSAIRLRDYFAANKKTINTKKLLEDYADELERNLIGMDNYDKEPIKSERYQLWLETNSALKAVKRIQSPNYDYTDKKSGVSIKELLSMAWLAMNDDNIRTFTRNDDTTYISDRDDALAKLRHAMYEAERGYNLNDDDIDDGKASRAICPPGTFNKIIEGMNTTVRGVEIILATKDYALNELQRKAKMSIESHLDSLPKTTPEERHQYATLLETLKQDGTPEPLWETLKKKIIDAFRAEFSILYTNDSDVLLDTQLTADVENAIIYLDISELINKRIKQFAKTNATPSTQGMFAQPNPVAPNHSAPEHHSMPNPS